jgi:hypothetical protein
MQYTAIKKHTVPVLKHHDIKTYNAMTIKLHAFLTSALNGDDNFTLTKDPQEPIKLGDKNKCIIFKR